MQGRMKKRIVAISALFAVTVANISGIGTAQAQTVTLTAGKIDNVEFKTEVGKTFDGSFLKELEVKSGETGVFRTEVQSETDIGDDLIFAARKTGDGTIENPIPIYSVTDLRAMEKDAESMKKSYILMNNIDLGKYTDTKPWIGIGHVLGGKDGNFSGTFDGNNYAIINMHNPNTGSRPVSSLFYALNGAEVKNLIIKDFTACFGALAQIAIDSTISNCTVMDGAVVKGAGVVSTAQNTVLEDCALINVTVKKSVAGGFVRTGMDRLVLKNCHVQSSTIDGEGGWSTGGLVGDAKGILEIDNCSVSADTTIKGIVLTGGLVGFYAADIAGKGSLKVTNSVNRAKVYGPEELITDEKKTEFQKALGGIVGYAAGPNVQIENCANLGDVRIAELTAEDTGYVTSGYAGNVFLGGIIGYAMRMDSMTIKNCLHAGALGVDLRAAALPSSTVQYIATGIGYSNPAPGGSATISNCLVTGFVDIANASVQNAYAAGIMAGHGCVENSVFAGTLYKTMYTCDADMIACSADVLGLGNTTFGPHTGNSYVKTSGITSSYGTEREASQLKEAAPYSAFDMTNIWAQEAGALPYLKIQNASGAKVPTISGSTTYGRNALFVDATFDKNGLAVTRLLNSDGKTALPAGFYQYVAPNTAWHFYYKTDAITPGEHMHTVKLRNATGDAAADSAKIKGIGALVPPVNPGDPIIVPQPTQPLGTQGPSQTPVPAAYDLFLQKWIKEINGKTVNVEQNVPVQVQKGDTIVYGIRVTNQGTMAAAPGRIVDKMPKGMSFSKKDNGDWTQRPDGSLELKVSDVLQPQASKEFTIALTVATDEAMEFVNIAYIEDMVDVYGKPVPNTNSQDGGKPDKDKNNVATITTEEFEDMYKTGEALPISLAMGSAFLACAAAFGIVQYRKRKSVSDSL